MLKRLYFALCASLALCACSLGGLASTGAAVADAAGAPAPASVANKTVLDEQAALGVELAYKAARLSMETAVDAGLLKGAGATKAAAIDNQAYLAVATVRQAYRAGNAASYKEALEAARAVISDLIAARGN